MSGKIIATFPYCAQQKYIMLRGAQDWTETTKKRLPYFLGRGILRYSDHRNRRIDSYHIDCTRNVTGSSGLQFVFVSSLTFLPESSIMRTVIATPLILLATDSALMTWLSTETLIKLSVTQGEFIFLHETTPDNSPFFAVLEQGENWFPSFKENWKKGEHVHSIISFISVEVPANWFDPSVRLTVELFIESYRTHAHQKNIKFKEIRFPLDWFIILLIQYVSKIDVKWKLLVHSGSPLRLNDEVMTSSEAEKKLHSNDNKTRLFSLRSRCHARLSRNVFYDWQILTLLTS